MCFRKILSRTHMVEMENKMDIESTKLKSLKMELDSMNIKTISSDQN